VSYIEKNGIKNGIDYLMGTLNPEICYETRPQLCFSAWEDGEGGSDLSKRVDSNIQYDSSAFDFTVPYVQIINLERRKDRKMNMVKKLEKVGINHYNFFKAVDGTIMNPTGEIKTIFKGNDFDNQRGVIGCAMSHYQLWKQLLDDDDNDFYLILEDDINFVEDFQEQLENILDLEPKDIIFLAYSMSEENRNKMDTSKSDLECNKLDKNRYIGGFFSYLITKDAAKKLVHYIQENGIKHGIDYLIKIMDNLETYEIEPQLTHSAWNENGDDIDSDVQNGYATLSFPDGDYVFIQGLDQIGHDAFFRKASRTRCILSQS